MMERTPIRVALVGCGRISQSHFEAMSRLEGLELAAVCDIVEERARAAGERWGVRSFTSYERMLAEVPCEAVAIATPSGLHPSHGILAARGRGSTSSARSRWRSRSPRPTSS
jgi:UDP-N-acetyl-2-amino-2-deoxyglucuronate dehydrogenase